MGSSELALRLWIRSNSPASSWQRDGAQPNWIGWRDRERYSGSGVVRTSARPRNHLGRRDQHRRLIAATMRQTLVDSAISHMSAAVCTTSPYGTTVGRVHITRDQSGGGKVRRYVHLHAAPLPEIDICIIEGQR